MKLLTTSLVEIEFWNPLKYIQNILRKDKITDDYKDTYGKLEIFQFS